MSAIAATAASIIFRKPVSRSKSLPRYTNPYIRSFFVAIGEFIAMVLAAIVLIAIWKVLPQINGEELLHVGSRLDIVDEQEQDHECAPRQAVETKSNMELHTVKM
jgi:hypothetical protein